MNNEMDSNQQQYFRDELRNARAATLSDAENFLEILYTLERMGSFMAGKTEALGNYKPQLRAIAERSSYFELAGAKWGASFDALFHIVKEARNDCMHTGAFARHAATNSVLISLMLEDALMNEASTLNEFMVSDPVCAELWQPIGLIRQKMLANSFSFLPVKYEKANKGWALISDVMLARLLRGDSNNQRKKKLATSLADAVRTNKIKLTSAHCCTPETTLTSIRDKIQQEPILLFKKDNRDNLLGLVTAFDLM